MSRGAEEAGLGVWAVFVFWGKFLKKLGIFLFWAIFYFFWHNFTVDKHWFFKSVYLATNTLHLMLENF